MKLRVISLVDAPAITGPAKNIIQFARRANVLKLDDFEVEVSMATIRRAPQKPNDPLLEAARAAGIEIDVLEEKYRYDPAVSGQLKELVRRRGAALIETHGVRLHFLARASGLASQLPWLAFHHGYTAEDLKMRAYNQLDRWSLRKAGFVFADCIPFAKQLEHFGIPGDRIRPLSSSIEIREPASAQGIQTLREQLKIENGESVILSIGRLSAEKAQPDLIAAAAHLRRSSPKRKFRLILVGDGPERSRLEQASAAQGIAHLVFFAGQQLDVRHWYGIASVFALSSLSEGSPNVLLEAMAAGVPIVSTAVGGVPEMLEHEQTGLLVPPRDPQAMAESMERLLTDPDLGTRLTKNAGVAVRERFSPEAYCRTVVEQYRALYLQRQSSAAR
jgi:glycosyltransferase involved in cell wall biosynthesis